MSDAEGHAARDDAGPETPWEHVGSRGESILGVHHAPAGAAIATVVLAHGLKGFMDYGMFPWLARRLAAAGAHVHRFNFSHSGMTRDLATFARPDLFEHDTWNRQVEDLAAIDAALAGGDLPGGEVPRVLIGHSRGGVSVLLAAGRGTVRPPAGVATVASPADATRLSDEEAERLRRDGFLPMPSARTGQELRVGRTWLDEIEADPVGHDPCVQAGRLGCPVLIVHGAGDATIPVADADRLAGAAGVAAERLVHPSAGHVFDVAHPMAPDQPPSEALEWLGDALSRFVREVATGGE